MEKNEMKTYTAVAKTKNSIGHYCDVYIQAENINEARKRFKEEFDVKPGYKVEACTSSVIS